MHRARRAAVAAVPLLLLGLAGCGQDGEISLPTALPSVSLPSASLPALPSPTRSLPALPSPTRTGQGTPTQAPTEEPPPTEPTDTPPEEVPTPEPTESESTAVALPPADDPTTTAPTTAPPTTTSPTATSSPTPTESPTTATPTESPSPTQTASETASPTGSEPASPTESEPASPSASAQPDEPASANLSLWLGLLALLALAIGVIVLLMLRSRRGRWDARLAEERSQATWLLTGLLPAVTDPATTPALRAAHWAGAQATLDQLDSGLAALLPDAPDQDREQGVRTLAQAVSGVRAAVAADLALRTGSTGAGPADEAALQASAAGVQAARDRLAAALATPAA